MSRVPCCLLAAALATPLAAQPNPFKVQSADLPAARITYTLAGDVTGTSMTAFTGDRMVTRTTSTGKMLGQEITTESWSLVMGDSIWSADLAKGTGTSMPNLLPFLAREYDELDKDGRKRLHANMQGLAQLMSKMFTLSALESDERGDTRTIAGEKCRDRHFGPFVVCNMEKAPSVALYTQGSLFCMDMEQTATAVDLGPVPPGTFAIPEGVTFTPMDTFENPDSLARGFVLYLSSEALRDSLEAAAKEMERERKETVEARNMSSAQADSVDRAQMQAVCEALENIDVGKMMADAADQALKDWADGMKEAGKNKLKGLIRKPKFP